jgi:transposase
MMHRAEVITVERRRRWSWTDKQQIVDETLMPGASISAVARRYGLHPSQVFAWRKAVREGDIEQAGAGALDCVFAPVVLTGGSRVPPSGAIGCGRMEIVLVNGRRIVVDAGADAAALDRVVTVLERR